MTDKNAGETPRIHMLLEKAIADLADARADVLAFEEEHKRLYAVVGNFGDLDPAVSLNVLVSHTEDVVKALNDDAIRLAEELASTQGDLGVVRAARINAEAVAATRATEIARASRKLRDMLSAFGNEELPDADTSLMGRVNAAWEAHKRTQVALVDSRRRTARAEEEATRMAKRVNELRGDRDDAKESLRVAAGQLEEARDQRDAETERLASMTASYQDAQKRLEELQNAAGVSAFEISFGADTQGLLGRMSDLLERGLTFVETFPNAVNGAPAPEDRGASARVRCRRSIHTEQRLAEAEQRLAEAEKRAEAAERLAEARKGQVDALKAANVFRQVQVGEIRLAPEEQAETLFLAWYVVAGSTGSELVLKDAEGRRHGGVKATPGGSSFTAWAHVGWGDLGDPKSTRWIERPTLEDAKQWVEEEIPNCRVLDTHE